ncbi:MauE/DoxX family redox-associated membrane protein [Nocardia aurantiaca]|uniref:Redoxin domain-containing protein n=1 Tax=Nocardia aurantiaca TaxID=2675850 RepID=A0A6I3L5N9_9NOCA|nr:MauE/DoxX family redox-associated membrane protein [Nocardia aurantiaca]MTE16668.1 redoxin domain-containing protein [Nocardia aurantiaca]
MLIESGVWVARLALAAVFALSAWGKWTDPLATRQAVQDFGVPLRWTPLVAIALPVPEAVIAVAVLPPWTAVISAAAAVLLLAVFTAAVARLLHRGQRPVCSCFGALSTQPIGPRTLIRNVVLILLALAVCWGSVRYPGLPGALSVDRSIGTAALIVVLAILTRLLGEVGALRRRIDELALSTLGAEGLPPGAVAPEFELLNAAGGRTTLETLLGFGRAVLLVFVHPACEMCAALARELPRWQARTERTLTIAVVGNGDVAEHLRWGREHGLGEIPVLVQQGNEAALRYRVRGTPSAVLIDADGRVAAPVARGAMAIRDVLTRAKIGTPQQPSDRNGQRVLDAR